MGFLARRCVNSRSKDRRVILREIQVLPQVLPFERTDLQMSWSRHVGPSRCLRPAVAAAQAGMLRKSQPRIRAGYYFAQV